MLERKNVEMPITEQMFAILEQGKSPQHAIEDLMTRAARSEVWKARFVLIWLFSSGAVLIGPFSPALLLTMQAAIC